MHPIVRKLEIDVMQSTELNEAMDIAHKYGLPAIVVHPDIAVEASLARARKQARCAILTPIDWPKGERDGMAKMQNMSVSALSTDGFEILLSAHEKEDNIVREAVELVRFIRNHLPEAVEIRLVLGTINRDREIIGRMCEAMSRIPSPNYIRTDHNLRVQQVKANASAHADIVSYIRERTTKPLKLSGNFNTAKSLACCKVDRYAVSLKQAQAIIQELKQPEKEKLLRKLLDQLEPKQDNESGE